MEQDALTDQIDTELVNLQDTLKTRLKETTDLSNLNQDVFEQTMKLERHSATLESTARRTKWKWFFEYIKWLAIGGVIILLLLFILLKPLFK
ncbi:hypothetical protein PAEPH01_0319 [Pancytospora epiphaga]|nr:hypothetical protein PAEPH01_0319 [Pancytospora epiphaga]